MSYNESCQCQSCVQERYSNPGQVCAYSNLASGQGFGSNMGAQHIEKAKSLELRKVEALEAIAKQSERIANMLSVMK